MTFLSRFLFAWRNAKLSAYDEAADHEDFWTNEDGMYLRSFFATQTGRKLKSRLTNFTFKAAISATRSPNELAHYCGRAQGAMDAVLFMQQHFAPEPQRAAEPETEQDPLEGISLPYADV